MKILIVSDLHLEFRFPHFEYDAIIEMIAEAAREIDEDGVLVMAGDLHPHEAEREDFLLRLRHKVLCPFLSVMGNHDFYRASLWQDQWEVTLYGKRFVGVTLWTDFNRGDPVAKRAFSGLWDSKLIRGCTADAVSEIHERDLAWIAEKKPDVVISHHCPSMKSVHSKWGNDPMNYSFSSDLDEFILANPSIKLWVHGHTHDAFDYEIGDCRIVCNPLGYPKERGLDDYQVKVIEI